MLVQFIVDNFLSFGSRQEFSMFAGKGRTYPERIQNAGGKSLLQFAALFGANASGKSNLMKAMAFMDTVVEHGKLPRVSSDQYCRTNKKNKGRPSYFESIIFLDDNFYSYGFEAILSSATFTAEWLIQLDSKGMERPVFTRNITNGVTEILWQFEEAEKQRLQLYADDIRNDGTILLLPVMNMNKKQLYEDFPNLGLLQRVYQWFSAVFEVKDPMIPITRGDRYLIDDTLKEISELLNEFDTEIKTIQTTELPKEVWDEQVHDCIRKAQERLSSDEHEDKSPQGVLFRSRSRFLCVYKMADDEEWKVRTFSFIHENGEVFQIGEESDGTLRIMDLAEIVLTQGPKVFVIDELNRSLHPQLTYKFIQRVLKHIVEKPIQVIVTTHESRLLDFDLLRRDEVWFIEKREGKSSLYSLEEFNERNDRKIDKAYLDGRYGAVPIFAALYPNEGDE